MESESRICVMCNGVIDTQSPSFEQRLVDDRDFCRTCWDDMMFGKESEVPLPVLVLEGR